MVFARSKGGTTDAYDERPRGPHRLRCERISFAQPAPATNYVVRMLL
jgi:hypothetical protein